MTIVITAGGTKERIDNVRNITNSSSGNLGLKIAKSFVDEVPNCSIIYIHGGNALPCDLSPKKVTNICIRDTKELFEVVQTVLTENVVDIFVHSMAVADYNTDCLFDFEHFQTLLIEANAVPTKETIQNYIKLCSIDTSSKISSSLSSPMLRLSPTIKVIEQIKKISPYTFLVGFKLLDNVSEDVLFDAGFNLLRKSRCNLVLANDLSLIREGKHTGMLIYPEKTLEIIHGKDSIAITLVKKALERVSVKHPKSIKNSEKNILPQETFLAFRNTGMLLDQKDFLPKVINHNNNAEVGTYGNLSCRYKAFDGFFITGRNVNKGNLESKDIVFVSKVNILNDNSSTYSNVFYHGIVKPSIDASIHSQIYELSDCSHIIHIHTNKVFLGHPLISKSYPCGCDLECNAILEILKNKPECKVIQMKKHGLIILGNSFEDCCDTLDNLFTNTPCIDYSTHEIPEECLSHIQEVGMKFKSEQTYPLKLNEENVGCIYEEELDTSINFGLFTMSNIRDKKLHIVEKYLNLYKKTYYLFTTPKCNIAEFYKKKYGFRNFIEQRNLIVLARDDK